MGGIALRSATCEDRSRIIEISSQIWDGQDFVPESLGERFSDRDGEVVGAVIDSKLVGFARRTWLAPGLAWFEGIRADLKYRGHGVGRASTEYLIGQVRAAGATRVNLSTCVANEVSIHIIDPYGFERIATLIYRERPADARPLDPDAEADPKTAPVSEDDAVEYVAGSPFLRLASRRFPRGWTAAVSPLFDGFRFESWTDEKPDVFV